MDATKRQRRYTIARPESALKLLTENDDALQEEDQQFDRISDILSNLIQEANQAVSVPLTLPPRPSTSSTLSYTLNKKKSPKRPVSYPSRRSLTPMPSTIMTTKRHHVAQRNNTTPVLIESFKRLDSSMAILDSLSKDLVPAAVNKKQKKKQHSSPLAFDTRLSALILLPLFHVPHVLISMAFDSISSYDNLMPATSSSQSNSFSGMLIWAFIFAVTNVIMVENTLPSSSSSSSSAPTTTHHIIPGAYNVKRRRQNSSSSSKRSDGPNRQFYLQRHDRAMRALHMTPPPPSQSTAALTHNGFRLSSAAVRTRRNSF